MKKIILLSFIAFLFVGCAQQRLTPVQKMRKAQREAQNVEKIELPDFTFYPTFVTPEFGIERNIGAAVTAYMRVSKNNINAELPYLGRFYIRPVSRLDIPVQFTSDKFIYTVSYDNDNQMFNILIVPQDVAGIIDNNMIINMKMDKNGNGEVSVKTDGRDEIQYRGSYR